MFGTRTVSGVRRGVAIVAAGLVSAVVATAAAAPGAATTAPAAAPLAVVTETTAPASTCAGAWSETTAYQGGATASHHGRNFVAKWWTQRESPGATSAWTDAGACTGLESDFVVSEAEFDAIFPKRDAFYTYQGLVDALAAYPRFANTGTDTMKTQEAAAFLTHADFESVGLRYVKEINTANYWIKCDYSQSFGCPAGQEAYYGRGPIMFSWNFNYKAAGDALGIDLLNNPWLVEQDPSIAWQTALWYWNTQNGPGVMTSHEAMVGGAGFGQTINSLNGALECNGGNPASVQSRVDRYQKITAILGVAAGSGLTC
ncbi:chitinase [Oerskovia sp. Root918]|uniref:glycoside hydrolase family 19 protein n=1 Tax=unclassified Oerskovia TaxID=2619021 RepID=UPI0006F5C4DC|nr:MULTISPECIES: glycoside hydrolase family 19 protein [unclassified Oerskovia]KRC34238.1 chitinase [Oerskovia sp. Root22]KRD47418.1 chitinase [Oerskovia sp. Root918]